MMRLLLGLALIVAISAQQAQAQAQVCEDLFKRETQIEGLGVQSPEAARAAEAADAASLAESVRAAEAVQAAMRERESLPLQHRLATTLTTIGYNGTPGLTEKTISEKGEIVLGLKNHSDPNGSTILAAYKLNTQLSPLVFRLAKLSSLDAKGNVVEVSTAPFDPETGMLRAELEARPDIAAIRSQLMLSLEADVTAEIRAGAKWLAFMQPHEFRALVADAPRSVLKLKLVGEKRRLLEFFRERVGRKVFDFIILGTVMSGASWFTNYIFADEQDATADVRQNIVTSMIREIAKLESTTGELPVAEREWLFTQIARATAKKAIEQSKQRTGLETSDYQMISNLDTGSVVYWLRDRRSGQIYLSAVRGLELDRADLKAALKTQVMVEISPVAAPTIYAVLKSQFGLAGRGK